MAPTMKKVDDIIEAAEENGKLLQSGLVYRYARFIEK